MIVTRMQCRVIAVLASLARSLGRFRVQSLSLLGGMMLVMFPMVGVSVNDALLGHQAQFQPQLIRVSPRVTMALGYDFSNISFIEGDSGTIVIDTGWFIGNVEPAWEHYREQVSSKPVVAIVYTHSHGDHTGGAGLFLREGVTEVYAPAGWQNYIHYASAELNQMVTRRAHAQYGSMLPEDGNGSVGTGVGPPLRIRGGRAMVKPTVEIGQDTLVTLAGVELEFVPSQGDLPEHLFIWLPGEKVLFAGDTVSGVLPYVSSARHEPTRDARQMMATMLRMRDYRADALVPGHGPLFGSPEDVDEVLSVTAEWIAVVTHGVDRLVNEGKSADEIIETLELPERLRQHRYLQPHYHRYEWMIRGLANKHTGWADEMFDLFRHTDGKIAERLVAALGGADEALTHAGRAARDGDPRWAAELAMQVRRIEPGNDEATRLLVAALRSIAESTPSANERNYALTYALELEGRLDWAEALRALKSNNEPIEGQ